MVTSLYSNQLTLLSSTGSNSIETKSPSTPGQDNALHSRLPLVLQTTLDLTAILNIFFEHIQDAVIVEGLYYHNNNHNNQINVQLGLEARHRCHYRLITSQDKLGEITFSRNRRFSQAELGTLERLISTLIYPLRNALQYREALQTAMRDPLTGAGNRVALDSALNRELQMAQRYNQALSLLIIDIDHFKQINDTFGHTSGDDVLRKVARTIIDTTRKTDLTFRYGGEEFVVILSKTTTAGCGVIAERLRHTIHSLPLEINNEPFQVSVSIGCGTLHAEENAQNLFDRADCALYQAKQEGRNRVVASEVTSQ